MFLGPLLTFDVDSTFCNIIQFDLQTLHAHSYIDQPAGKGVHVCLHVLQSSAQRV